ncbi:MAG: hemin-degrading factor [Bacteroidetes bacterium]|nr:MAG: hemin-degrading factor [Bacteroidota bacterium]
MEPTTLTRPDLKERWHAYRRAHPTTRIRNAAADLGVSEADLLAADEGDGVTRLDGGWGALLQELDALGEVMALTRNDACVHEKTGVYRNVKLFESHRMGLVLDEQIDLRLFLERWRFGFAVETPWEGGQDGLRRSLQFFDAHGTAVHKVFLTRRSDVAAYDRLVAKYRYAGSEPLPPVEPRPVPEPETPDAAVDRAALLQDWAELRDTHDFFPMLKAHGVSRPQALRLAEGTFTERVEPASARQALEHAAATETPIMVFVGNPGCIQIHTGPVRRLKATPPWFNVLDPGFQLHLNEEGIASAWVVRKPTRDGTVTALELFDAGGDVIAQFFGKRKPGLPEREDWRAIVTALPRQ